MVKYTVVSIRNMANFVSILKVRSIFEWNKNCNSIRFIWWIFHYFFLFVSPYFIVSLFYYRPKNKKTLSTWRCSVNEKKQYIDCIIGTNEAFNVVWWIINWPKPMSKWQLETNVYIYLETISRYSMSD